MSSHNNSSSSSATDPRQPSAASPFVPAMINPQDLPVDYSGFIAVAGVMFRYKLGSWLALIFCAQSLANMKNMENDLKQISMAMMGGLGVGAFPRIYGGNKRNDSCPPHFCESSGSVARHILQQLQNMNIIDFDAKG